MFTETEGNATLQCSYDVCDATADYVCIDLKDGEDPFEDAPQFDARATVEAVLTDAAVLDGIPLRLDPYDREALILRLERRLDEEWEEFADAAKEAVESARESVRSDCAELAESLAKATHTRAVDHTLTEIEAERRAAREVEEEDAAAQEAGVPAPAPHQYTASITYREERWFWKCPGAGRIVGRNRKHDLLRYLRKQGYTRFEEVAP